MQINKFAPASISSEVIPSIVDSFVHGNFTPKGRQLRLKKCLLS